MVDTLSVAILGHLLSICLATIVGIIGRLTLWIGSFIRVAAYNIQAYPIVAVAPIIFILLGDGLSSRLLIAAMPWTNSVSPTQRMGSGPSAR